jgi:hypothetical protein
MVLEPNAPYCLGEMQMVAVVFKNVKLKTFSSGSNSGFGTEHSMKK